MNFYFSIERSDDSSSAMFGLDLYDILILQNGNVYKSCSGWKSMNDKKHQNVGIINNSVITNMIHAFKNMKPSECEIIAPCNREKIGLTYSIFVKQINGKYHKIGITNKHFGRCRILKDKNAQFISNELDKILSMVVNQNKQDDLQFGSYL